MLDVRDVVTPEVLAMTAIGSMLVQNGKLYRVCAGSASAVKVATVKALNKMCIKVAKIAQESGQDVIFAMSGERRVEVRVEPLGQQSVRMRIFACQGEEHDVQTAAEVVACTERLLGQRSLAVVR